MTAETDFGDPASSVQSAVQGSINDYRLTLFITSSSIIIITLITIIGAVSCFILCNEDEELKEAELILDTPTREAYEGMIQALKEGKDVSFPAIGQDEFTITIDTESPMKTSFQPVPDDLEVAKSHPQDHSNPIPPQTYQLRPDSLMGGSMHHLQSGESPFHQSTPTPLIKRSLFSVLEEDSSSPQIPSLTLTSAKEMGPSTMGPGGGYSTKEDEFSNLIGLDESTEHTLNQLEADFARMRKTSERRRRQRSRSERMSFSEWTQKSKENQFKSGSPHRRKSFISRLKRNSSDKKETPTSSGQELSTISSFAGSTMVTLSGASARRRRSGGLTCFSGSLPVMKVLDDRMDVLAVPNLPTSLPKSPSPKPVFHCEPIVRVLGSQNKTRSNPLGTDGPHQRSPKSKTISIQTEPLEAKDVPAESPKKEEKPQRPTRLCTHCLETYTSPKRQQLTFLERKRFFESMATTPK